MSTAPSATRATDGQISNQRSSRGLKDPIASSTEPRLVVPAGPGAALRCQSIRLGGSTMRLNRPEAKGPSCCCNPISGLNTEASGCCPTKSDHHEFAGTGVFRDRKELHLKLSVSQAPVFMPPLFATTDLPHSEF